MKKKLITLLIAVLIPINVCAEPLLYDVLKNQAETGTLAKEFTGEHQDTLDNSGNQKIYHWFALNETDANAANNKRNVIFGGFCWEMLRTTDAGGVKLIYNGPAENDKCLDTRTVETRIDYSSYRTITPTTSFYFADSYTYDNESGEFTLINPELISFASTNPEDVIGKYTMLFQYDISISSLYKITGYDSENNKLLYDSIGAKPIYSIGRSALASYDDKYSLGTVGYMHNELYSMDSKTVTYGSAIQPSTPLTEDKYEVITNDTSYPATFDASINRWIFDFTGGSSYSYGTISFKVKDANDYILKFNTETNGYTRIYKNDIEIMEARYSTNSLIDLKGLTPEDTIKVYYSISNKYVPLYFSVETPNGAPTSDTRILLGNSVTYENGEYNLIDTVKTDGNASIKYHHYTCLNTTGKCDKVKFIFMKSGEYIYYFELSNGKTIEDVLNESLYNDDVNKYDSPAKELIDSWFEENLLDYLPYLEDAVYCNNRTITNPEAQELNPNGGYYDITFVDGEDDNNYHTERDLICPLETDRFAVNNPKAKLKYPIALPTADEMVILSESFNNYNAQNIRKKNNHYLTMSPKLYQSTPYNWVVQNSGHVYWMYGSDQWETRPVITLKAGTEYISGDGSKENPYVIKKYNYNAATIENDEKKGNVIIYVNDPMFIQEDSTVTFKVDAYDGYALSEIKVTDKDGNEITINSSNENEYQFTMPGTAVTISTSYTKESLLNPETSDYILVFIIIAALSLPLIHNLRKKQQEY